MRLAPIGPTAFALVFALLAALPAHADDDEQEIAFADCPAPVQKAFHEAAKDAKFEHVSREIEDGVTTYWATASLDGKPYSFGIDAEGTLQEISLEVDEDDIALADCPAAVRKAVQEEAKEGKVGPVKRDIRFGETVYTTIAEVGKKPYEIVVGEDGTLFEKSLVIEDDEVPLSDCPAAVQKALRDAAAGGSLGEITRSSGLGKPVFETEVKLGEKRYLLEVSETGHLIAKMLRHEDD